MKVIGLCGGSGSGKGAVSAFFEKLGFCHIDADAIYRTLTSGPSDCLDALSAEFGKDILTINGALDRRRLASIVFESEGAEKKRKTLNKISHKFVLNKIREEIAISRSRGKIGALVDAPLLFESGFDSECDKIVCVVADIDIRIKRIIDRDGISEDAALARINSQISDESLKAKSDYVIVNNGSLAELEKAVISIAEDIKNL